MTTIFERIRDSSLNSRNSGHKNVQTAEYMPDELENVREVINFQYINGQFPSINKGWSKSFADLQNQSIHKDVNNYDSSVNLRNLISSSNIASQQELPYNATNVYSQKFHSPLVEEKLKTKYLSQTKRKPALKQDSSYSSPVIKVTNIQNTTKKVRIQSVDIEQQEQQPNRIGQQEEQDAYNEKPSIKFNHQFTLHNLMNEGIESSLREIINSGLGSVPIEGSLDLITKRINNDHSSQTFSRKDLSINNQDRPINELSRLPIKPPSWKNTIKNDSTNHNTSSNHSMNMMSMVPRNNEFSDNVMHILDRSHQKYNLKIDDDFTIESDIAKKKIKTQLKLMKVMGPNKYQEYYQDQVDKQSRERRSRSTMGIYPIKKPQERNHLFHKEILDRTQSRRKNNRVDHNEKDPEFQNILNSQKAKQYFLSTQEMKDEKVKDDDYFLPDIKDYHRIIERGLERLKEQNYDDWSMLVKLCFENPFKQKLKESQVFVASVELMRFHPFFNKLSYYAVRDFLQCCRLIKLRANQLLFRQEDVNPNVYIILFGKMILHHRTLGGLGVLGMNSTVGEETLAQHNCKRKKDAVYAQCETYLLEYDDKDWAKIKELLIRTGNRTDYILIDQLIQHNYHQKKHWRLYKERSYVNIKTKTK